MTNTWQEDMEWYKTHQTAREIGFDPDGMCLKVCRTSRGIGPKYLTAKQAQDATPRKFRVHKVSDLRQGMKLFFDDPNDSNTAGHIVTMIGRVRGGNRNSLDDVLVETNSVKSGELVVVRASYFKQHWGDGFQFGAFHLNGVEFDYHGSHVKDGPQRDESPRVQNFRESGNKWNVNILDRAVKLGGRRDIAPKVKAIEAAVRGLPDDKDEDSRVSRFKETFEKDRVLDMALLNHAVNHGRDRGVKRGRDELRAIIKSVLFH